MTSSAGQRQQSGASRVISITVHECGLRGSPALGRAGFPEASALRANSFSISAAKRFSIFRRLIFNVGVKSPASTVHGSVVHHTARGTA